MSNRTALIQNIFNPLFITIISLIVIFTFFFQLSNNSHSIGDGYNASNIIGQINFNYRTANNNFATDQSLKSPYDTELDSTNHRLFVADASNGRVLVYNLDSSDQLIDSTADYVIGQSNMTEYKRHCDANLDDNNFCFPGSLALDIPSQTLFVSDTLNNRIMIFDISELSNGMSASGVLGQSNFTDNDPNQGGGTPTQSSLYYPEGIDFDTVNNRLFVTDRINLRVLVMNFDPENYTNGQNFSFVLGKADFTTLGGGTCPGASSTIICYPYGLSYDPGSEKLFVADTSYNRVLIYDASIAALSNGDAAINVLGQSNFTNQNIMAGLGTSSPKGFDQPTALAIDLGGDRLFVGDNQRRVYVFDISTITDFEDAVNVIGQSSFSSNECSTTISASVICGVTNGMSYSESFDTLYLPDYSRNRVLGFDLSTISDGEDATQLIGQDTFLTNFENGLSPLNAGGFYSPFDVEIDNTNNRLFVNDFDNNRILVFNTDSNIELLDGEADFVINSDSINTEQPGDCGPSIDTLCFGEGFALDENGNRLFVADSNHNRILVFDVSVGNLENGIEPINVIGQDDFDSDDCTTAIDRLCYPTFIDIDDVNDFLYVADDGNNRVIGYDISGSNLVNGMNASRVLGQPDFDTDNGGDSGASGLYYPYDVSVNTNTNQLFVADYNNSRVVIYDISEESFENGMNAEFVIGQVDFSSDNCDDPTLNLCNVYGIDIDVENNLLYAIMNQPSRLMVYDISEENLENGISPIGIIGQTDFDGTDCNQGSGENVGQSTICDPTQVTVNQETGDVFLADSANHRILQYKFVKISNTSFSNGESGEVYSQPLTFVNGQGTESAEFLSGTLPPGLSVDGDEITGTPTTTGSYTFTLKVSDDNGDNGIFTQNQEFTILVDAELIDTDDDGITDVIENAGPNDGDSNNDNILDSEQLNVTTFVNEVTDNYVTLHTSTSCNEITTVDIITTDTDNAFDYPLGLLSFTALCDNPGDTVTVTQYFYEDLDSTLLTPRKYNPNTQQYQTITEHTLTEDTIGGETAIVLTFDITDGGSLDIDGTENSVIMDPAGLAENSVGTPDTGLGGMYFKK